MIDLIVQAARKLGADRRPVSLTDLHRTFLEDNPSITVGLSADSFSATLAFHCINMRSRFPNVRNRRAPAPWLRRPLFKWVARGQYMLLSDEEIARFKRCVAQDHPLVYQDAYDVAQLIPDGNIYPASGQVTNGGSEDEAGAIADVGQLPQRTMKAALAATRGNDMPRPYSSSLARPADPSDPQLLDVLRAFVLTFANSEDISLRDEPGRPDLALPVAVRGPKGSHYLLLAATIDVGTNSNHIRPFLVRLGDCVPGGLFAIDSTHASIILATIEECQRQGLLPGWQAKREVPRILADVNAFVDGEAQGDLDSWARQFTSPHQIVQVLAQHIYFQGREPSSARKKLWMFMRWVVRPAPDLRLWDHLSPRDLLLPVDRHIARVAEALGLISALQAANPTRTEVDIITAFTRTLFPDDPTCVDYAFFLWGRGSTAKVVSPDSCCGEFAERDVACPLRHSLPCSLLCR